jgi:hypothetical protein
MGSLESIHNLPGPHLYSDVSATRTAQVVVGEHIWHSEGRQHLLVVVAGTDTLSKLPVLCELPHTQLTGGCAPQGGKFYVEMRVDR